MYMYAGQRITHGNVLDDLNRHVNSNANAYNKHVGVTISSLIFKVSY